MSREMMDGAFFNPPPPPLYSITSTARRHRRALINLSIYIHSFTFMRINAVLRYLQWNAPPKKIATLLNRAVSSLPDKPLAKDVIVCPFTGSPSPNYVQKKCPALSIRLLHIFIYIKHCVYCSI